MLTISICFVFPPRHNPASIIEVKQALGSGVPEGWKALTCSLFPHLLSTRLQSCVIQALRIYSWHGHSTLKFWETFLSFELFWFSILWTLGKRFQQVGRIFKLHYVVINLKKSRKWASKLLWQGSVVDNYKFDFKKNWRNRYFSNPGPSIARCGGFFTPKQRPV